MGNITQHYPTLLNILIFAGFRIFVFWASYCASKHASLGECWESFGRTLGEHVLTAFDRLLTKLVKSIAETLKVAP